jgi:hypothetical protein
MLKTKRIFLLLLASVLQVAAKSQETITEKVGDNNGFMRSEGKIYVVVAVVMIILSGLIIYVARLDRKITRLEKDGPDPDPLS